MRVSLLRSFEIRELIFVVPRSIDIYGISVGHTFSIGEKEEKDEPNLRYVLRMLRDEWVLGVWDFFISNLLSKKFVFSYLSAYWNYRDEYIQTKIVYY